jgi:hypothetical protein
MCTPQKSSKTLNYKAFTAGFADMGANRRVQMG